MVVVCCTSCVELEYWFGISAQEEQAIYSRTVSFMGDLYWSSLANSLMDYDWCKLMKRNRFRHGITVL